MRAPTLATIGRLAVALVHERARQRSAEECGVVYLATRAADRGNVLADKLIAAVRKRDRAQSKGRVSK